MYDYLGARVGSNSNFSVLSKKWLFYLLKIHIPTFNLELELASMSINTSYEALKGKQT